MSDPFLSPPPPRPSGPQRPSGPRLPSLRVSGALAAVLFALGIALGAAIGPAPQSSVAGPLESRALVSSVLPAVLAARAQSRSPAQSSTPSPSASGLSTVPTPTPAPAVSLSASGASASGTGGGSGTSGSGTSGTSGLGTSGALPPTVSSPTLSGSTGSSDATGTAPSTPAAPAPITHVWLVVLPGQGFSSAQAQPSTAPYLAQLLGQGILLSDYSPLDASALGADAALLSGRSAPQLSVLSAPGCHEEAGSSTCPPGSPAGLAAADGWLREVVPHITASADYREGGLLTIIFAAAAATAQPTGTSTAGTGTDTSASGASAGMSSPSADASSPPGAAGANATTLATQPLGVLLLSPFLRSHGQSSTPFHPASPRKNLEQLFRS